MSIKVYMVAHEGFLEIATDGDGFSDWLTNANEDDWNFYILVDQAKGGVWLNRKYITAVVV